MFLSYRRGWHEFGGIQSRTSPGVYTKYKQACSRGGWCSRRSVFCRCCWFELLYVLQVLIACTIIDLCLFVAAAPQKGILSLDSLVEFVAVADLHGDSACHRHALFCLYQDKKSTSKTQKHSDKGSHSTADGRDVFLKNKNSRVRSVPTSRGKKKVRTAAKPENLQRVCSLSRHQTALKNLHTRTPRNYFEISFV